MCAGRACPTVFFYQGGCDQNGETPRHGTCSIPELMQVLWQSPCGKKWVQSPREPVQTVRTRCPRMPGEVQPSPRGATAWGHSGDTPVQGAALGTESAAPALPLCIAQRLYLIRREISWSLMIQGGLVAPREPSNGVVVHRAPSPQSWEKLSRRTKESISLAKPGYGKKWRG